MTKRGDVVVVGAGPVGLSVALGLARAGRSVLVLEKEPQTGETSRAPAIWPRTQEVLAGLGVLDRFLAAGITLDRIQIWDADRDRALLRLPLAELEGETPYPQLLVLPQAETEGLLAAALEQQASAIVRFSAEAVEVDQSDSTAAVTVRCAGQTETVGASFVVGCDGAHSTVRESLGVSFEGITYPMHAALADIVLDEDRELRFPRLSTRRGLAVAIRVSPEVWRLIMPFASSDERTLDDRTEDAVASLFPETGYRTRWQSEFRLHRRVASDFVAGRVVLAGDAAHLNSPVGGQGMNAGIQDAEALVAALVLALESGDPAPLAVYAEERRQAIEAGVNRFTDQLTRLLLVRRGRLVKQGMRLADLAIRLSPLRRRLLRRIAMLEMR